MQYLGSDKSRDEYQRLALQFIPQILRDEEARLQKSRWFDYRMMTPAQATYCFAGHYRQQYVEAYKKTRDIRTADRIRPFAPEDIFACKELNAMWQARQAADAIGCPYEFFLRVAFERCAARGWRRLPRPNHLIAEEMVLDIKDAWALQCAASLQLAKDALFLAERYDELPEQSAYYTWLCDQIAQREHPHFALSRLVYDEAMLPEEVAAQRFSQSVLQKAYRFRNTI